MKFLIAKNPFFNALQIVNHAIESNSSKPALNGVLIEATDDGLILTGSESFLLIQYKLNNTMDEDLQLSINETGSIVIDARYLLDIVRKMDSDVVHVEIIDGALTRFSGGNAEFKINGYRPSDYGSFDLSTPPTSFTMHSATLNQLIQDTVFATSTKDIKPNLTGVNLRSNGTSLIATATDSFRLAKKTILMGCNEFNITVPAKCLKEVRSIFNESELTIALDTKKIQFSSDRILLQSSLIEGGYPETDSLIPTVFSRKLIIDRQALIRAIDRTSFIKTDNMPVIRLHIKDKDEITISNKSQEIGESKEELNAISYTGDPIDISFSGNYVIDAAKSLKEENVMIQFNAEMKPFVLTNAIDKDNLLQLVLPVKTYN